MLGVSFDMDKKEWQDAIKRDTLNWEQVCDFGGLNSEVAKQYAIKQVPSNILFWQQTARFWQKTSKESS